MTAKDIQLQKFPQWAGLPVNPYAALFILCLAIHIYCVSIGWNNTINDFYAFRQSQTAITAYYAAKYGIQLAYLTPVLGPPWKLPFELPLYQWIVAGTFCATRIPLDQCGRLVNVLFFYASFFPAYSLLKRFIPQPRYRFFCLSLWLASPVYIFWSRAFLIESVALFLSLCYLALAFELLQKRTALLCVITCLVGALASLTKVTTFLAYCGPAALAVAWHWRSSRISWKSAFLLACVLVAIPLVSTYLWLNFTDTIKGSGQLTDWLVSSKLRAWTYSTAAQRLQPAVWNRILIYSFHRVIGWPVGTVVVCCALLAAGAYRRHIALCVIFAIIPTLIFTNFYAVHLYYSYANGPFVVAALGFALVELLGNKKWDPYSKAVLIVFVFLNMYYTWHSKCYPLQSINNTEVGKLALSIKSSTDADGVILIYGHDWDPTIPYYAERKAIMSPIGLAQPIFQAAVDKAVGTRIAALVISGNYLKDRQFVAGQISKYNMSPQPSLSDPAGDLYLPLRKR